MPLATDVIVGAAREARLITEASGGPVAFHRGTRRKQSSEVYTVDQAHEEYAVKTGFEDLQNMGAMARGAQTIVIPNQTAIDAFNACLELRTDAEQLPFRLPYQQVSSQFAPPVPELAFMATELPPPYVRDDETAKLKNDKIIACLVAQADDDPSMTLAGVWFESLAVNLVSFYSDRGEIFWGIDPRFERYFTHDQKMNKYRIMYLAQAMVALVNARNVTLDRVGPTDKAQAKRRRKGKRPLPTYCVTRITKTVHESAGAGTSGWHPRLHSVRGHFRHYKSGKVVWIASHLRGFHGDDLVERKSYVLADNQKG